MAGRRTRPERRDARAIAIRREDGSWTVQRVNFLVLTAASLSFLTAALHFFGASWAHELSVGIGVPVILAAAALVLRNPVNQ